MKQSGSAYGALILAIPVLLAPAACAADALNFFNNWFVTGDYVVGGIGLRGTGVNGVATGSINLSGVPAGAEPIAAFLYWSTIEFSTTPQGSDGTFNTYKIRGYLVGNPQNPGCYSSGGTTGSAGAVGRVYRADVLRFLPFDSNNIRQANGSFKVSLADSGANGNGNLIYTNGASLVVIYRLVVPGNPAVAPLKSVVIYNGAFTMDKGSAGMTQTIAGFYDAAASATAKITDIVANGQSGFSSPLSVNGTTLSTNPFAGMAGGRWDNPTFGFSLSADASSFTTQVSVGTNQTCVTFAATVASTLVTDTDGDGLLNVWETKGLHRNTQVTPPTFGTCSDYPAEPCVNLPAMGADPNKKDIFIQIDWMNGTGGGGGIDGAGTHDHAPKLAALNSVANTFLGRGIKLHFDVGNLYQGPQAICGNAPCSYVIPSALAQGGTDIAESSLVCHDTSAHTCDYHTPYPVISFEFGFASVRDGNQDANIPAHFPQNRKDVFHYSLFAHALSGPFDLNGHPFDPSTGQPTSTPLSYSGIAERPGGGFMVTLGLWRSDFPDSDLVGSAQVQAGTFMHELGHNLGLGHGGLNTKPNCMPNYQSVMNYLYQTRGLTDASGLLHIDYSDGLLAGLNEASVSESVLLGSPKYRVRYYGPFNPVLDPPGASAKLTCDGKSIAGLPQMVRLENAFPSFIDWDHNGALTAGIFEQDINYDGIVPEVFADQADWSSLNLQQIGSGPNFGGLSVGSHASAGGLATDGGGLATDAGGLATDAGVFTTDAGGFATDAGGFATDGGGLATDAGGLATDAGGLATDAGDLSFTTVALSTIDSPPPPGSCPSCGLTATPKVERITLNWTAPDTGNIASYNVYRSDPSHPTPVLLSSVSGGKGSLTVDDIVNGSTTLFNTQYTYYVTSVVLINSQLNESQPSTVASGAVIHLYIAAQNASMKYGDPIPASFPYNATGLDPANITGVACTTTATQTSVPGTYPINCSAILSSPIDGVTYTAATLTITPRIITASITSSDKLYDTTTMATIASCTLNGVLAADIGNVSCSATGVFPNRNAGTYMVTATSITLSGPASIYYGVTALPATSSTYRIIPAPASVTPNAASKIYGTPDPALTGSLNGFYSVDGVTAVFTRAAGEDAGTYAISASLNPVAALLNYAVTYNPAVFTIFPSPQTITFLPMPDRILGTPSFTVSATASSGLLVSFTATGGCSVAGSMVTLTMAGLCTINASQGGNRDYLPAAIVSQSFHIAGFVATGSMATPRSYHTATLLNNGIVLVAGGFDMKGAPLASAELYDPAAKAFRSAANNMPNKAAGHTATLLSNGKVLMVGGGNSSSELYDPTANSFSSAGGIGGQRSYHTATLLGNGKVLIAGGSDNSGKTTNTAILYDPSTGSYLSTGSMTAARDFHTATLLTTGPNAGKVLIAGGRSGSSGNYTYLSSAELYDPSLGAFNAIPAAMTAARYAHTATVLNGQILIAGGAAPSSLNSAELYDPSAGAFTAAGFMATPRRNFTAFPFENAIVVAGGLNGSTPLASVEMDINSTFQSAGNMTSARAGHTATVLSSGAVLIAGGTATSGGSIANAEVLQ
jgi:hypothetical protein